MFQRMYEDATTWNPFVGCEFHCVYCRKSSQRQMKRQKHNCQRCYEYKPHFHPERLNKVPSGDLIFACAYGDVSFASRYELAEIFATMLSYPQKTFLIQSKRPACFYTHGIPENVVLGTTIETNRAIHWVSRAPETGSRSLHFAHPHLRKFVTIEPIMDFDLEDLVLWIKAISPEFVYVGYDNHNCGLPEPQMSQVAELIAELETFTEVRKKTMR